jgi:hypothetical protein
MMQDRINADDSNREWKSSPFELFHKRKEPDFILNELISYNQTLANRPCCFNTVQGKGSHTCSCLSALENGKDDSFYEAVAEYQYMFGSLNKDDQKKMVIEWMRNMPATGIQKKKKMFSIPFLLHEDDNSDEYHNLRISKICTSAMLDLLGKRRRWWFVCREHAKNNTLPSHALKGRTPNNKRKWNTLFEEDLKTHFEQLKQEAEPVATGVVRELTGETNLRDAVDADYFPPSVSKRSCYGRFCLERGWRISSSNKGTIQKTPIEGLDQQEIPSLTSYNSFWEKHYDKLKVRKPTEDICGYCYRIYNSSKFRLSTFDAEQVEDENNREGDLGVTCDDTSESTTTEGLVNVSKEVGHWERLLLDASLHVQRARAQRQLLHNKQTKATRDKVNNISHCNRHYCLIADYSQNLNLPHFGSTQPGETYFYTPLILYLFGVVDTSNHDHLIGHLFREGDGKKGGNSVSSLLIKTLRHLKIIQEDDDGQPITGGELNVFFDNCTGQNKNNYVLWLVPYLVEAGYFKTVNFNFLVVGHTKNPCDRRFNNVKRIYNKSNIYSVEMCLDICNKSEHCTILPVEDGDFCDYQGWLDRFYRKQATIGIKLLEQQIFSCSTDNNTNGRINLTVRKSDLDGDLPTMACIAKCRATNPLPLLPSASRTSKLTSPAVIPFEGIPTFKQVQLYKNFRCLLPTEYQDVTCPKPSIEALKMEEEDQKRRKMAKKFKVELEAQAMEKSVEIAYV